MLPDSAAPDPSTSPEELSLNSRAPDFAVKHFAKLDPKGDGRVVPDKGETAMAEKRGEE